MVCSNPALARQVQGWRHTDMRQSSAIWFFITCTLALTMGIGGAPLCGAAAERPHECKRAAEHNCHMPDGARLSCCCQDDGQAPAGTTPSEAAPAGSVSSPRAAPWASIVPAPSLVNAVVLRVQGYRNTDLPVLFSTLLL